jgi:xanthine dehydrogenase YagR molybdenum-binding subunit
VVYDAVVAEKKTEGDLPGEAKEAEQKGNVRGPNTNGAPQPEVDAALAGSPQLVEATYTTQVQTHCCMETHGVVAQWEDIDKLLVYASTQGTFSVRNELSEVFDLPKTNVRVITRHMGGGFGSKFGAGVYGVMAAKLAKKAKAPVKLMLDRKGEQLAAGNRPDSRQTLKIGATNDGKLTGIKLISFGTAGVGTGAGTSGPARRIYDCPAIHTQESDIFTNAGPGAAFRAPGHPQGAFALEQAIDELAYKVKMDPLEFRRINTTHHGIRQREYDLGAARIAWQKRNPMVAADRGPIKRGIGVANSVWYYYYGTGFQCDVQVNSDGSVEFHNGVQDIGTGIRTVLAMVVAEELGLKPRNHRQHHPCRTQCCLSGQKENVQNCGRDARGDAGRLERRRRQDLCKGIACQQCDLARCGEENTRGSLQSYRRTRHGPPRSAIRHRRRCSIL